jgi:hypothetical protein
MAFVFEPEQHAKTTVLARQRENPLIRLISTHYS